MKIKSGGVVLKNNKDAAGDVIGKTAKTINMRKAISGSGFEIIDLSKAYLCAFDDIGLKNSVTLTEIGNWIWRCNFE